MQVESFLAFLNRQDAKGAKDIAKGRYFALRERPQSKKRLRC